jgi:hypothetical protein
MTLVATVNPNFWSCDYASLYSTFTDKIEQSFHVLAPSRNCYNVVKMSYHFCGAVCDVYWETL